MISEQAGEARFPECKRIFPFELEGRLVLGFNTGLDERSFAQAKMARLLAKAGSIVFPDGRVEAWQPGGILEYDPVGKTSGKTSIKASAKTSGKTMVIWGLLFPGEELAALLEERDRKDEALNALRFWIRARTSLEKNHNRLDEPAQPAPPTMPGPAGALVLTRDDPDYPMGTVFFPPQLLLERILETDTGIQDAIRRMKPPSNIGSNSNEEISFCAGIMLYRIFCGAYPFHETHDDFIPPELAAPGLDSEMAALIGAAIGNSPQGVNKEKPCPQPEFIAEFLGDPSPSSHPVLKTVSSWQRKLSDEEISKIRTDEDKFRKKAALKHKARRFVIRNTAIIAISVIAITAIFFMVRSFEKRRAELPSTAGMKPIEVVHAYYNAFNSLDHTMMDACVSGRAGRNDINMVTGLFVATKVRQAYEMTIDNFLPASQWLEAGRPETDKTVFGITDLEIRPVSAGDNSASLEATYRLWMPGEFSVMEHVLRDLLELEYGKGLWRITKLVRSL